MFVAALSIVTVSAGPAAAHDLSGRAIESALLQPGDDGVTGAVALPAILSPEDAERYRRIFSLQETGAWWKADRIIKKLENRLLIGHVLSQRYLHPTKYRSRYRELYGWLKRYADHPDSERIYQLALKRRPRNARRPDRPTVRWAPSYDDRSYVPETTYRSPRKRSAATTRKVKRTLRVVRRFARSGRLTLAKQILARKRTQRLLDDVEMDIARAYIGAGHLIRGSAQTAFAFAGPAADRAGRFMPYAHWTAGLAAYRLGLYSDAARHFESMALNRGLSRWNVGAAAFWAARSNMIARQPERVQRWLEYAAAHPTTFYGLLARRVMGMEMPFRWDVPDLEEDHIATLRQQPAGERALALLQIGETHRAEREFRSLTGHNDRDLAVALLALSEAAQLPSLAMKTAGVLLQAEGTPHHAALYPVPRWRPAEGFVVDRAIIFAFMRQESGFNTRAKSHAGARGLMQLMPSTASYMTQTRFRGRRRAKLYDPRLNISIGQKYLRYLIEHEAVQGDLLMLAAAYNGGPGNLAKWRRRAERRNYLDPLLFIESIPSLETRIFIERVLANLWIYRLRLGQRVPSLDALAAGEQPIYHALDGEDDTKNARN